MYRDNVITRHAHLRHPADSSRAGMNKLRYIMARSKTFRDESCHIMEVISYL